MSDERATLPMGSRPSKGGIRAGDRVGNYTIAEPLGRGAMGIVFVAHDARLERRVALKVVNPEYAGGSEARQRLLKEARALARLSHENVVPVFDAGLHQGSVYVAMELVDGLDVNRWLKGRRRPWREVLHVFADAARGLQAAHDAGLIHRDFKPSNILLGTDGRARVVDFGLARAATPGAPTIDETAAISADNEPPGVRTGHGEDNRTGLTRDGMVMGTAQYMAPEQHYNEDVSPASDQYAFCVSLYEALYGVRPFTGLRGRELVLAKSTPPGRAPSGSPVPRAVHAVIARGLHPESDGRFDSVRDLATALKRASMWRRRRLFVPGAVVLAAGGAAAWFVVAGTTPCRGSLRTNEVWNADVGARLADAFAQTRLPYAENAWARSSQALDDYFARWRATYNEACETADPDRDHVMACLDARLRDADSLLTVLGDADPGTIRHAVEASRRLGPAEACAEPELWLSTEPLPADPALRAPVKAIRQEIARAAALHAAGRFPEALSVAEAAATESDRVGFEAATAEAYGQLGSTQEANSQIDAAAESLQVAYFKASEAGHDHAAADAAVDMVWISAERRYDFEAARRWAGLAQASLQRVGGDSNLSGQLHNALGATASNEGVYEQALAHYKRTLELVGDDSMLGLSAIINTGVVYQRQDDNTSARKAFSQAVEYAARTLGAEHPRTAIAINMLGVALRADGEIKEAVEAHRASIATLSRVLGENHADLAAPLVNLARAVENQGDAPEALALYRRALAIAEQHNNDNDACIALNNIGQTLTEEGYLDAARAYLRRSYALHVRSFGAGHPEVAYPLLGLGEIAEELRQFDEALVHYEQALEVTRSQPQTAVRLRAVTLDRIAGIHAARGELDDALDWSRKALAVFESVEGGSEIDVGIALTSLGKLHLQRGEHAEARRLIERSLSIYGETRGRPSVRAEAEFALAQALWPLLEARPRALRLTRAAIVVLEEGGRPTAQTLAKAQAWLSTLEPNDP